MNEKTGIWWRIDDRGRLEVLYEGRWEGSTTQWAYPAQHHNRPFRDLVAKACSDIRALTPQRDEAVRERDELRRQLRWAWLNIGEGCRCIFDDGDCKIVEDAHCYIHGIYVEKDQFREIDDSLTTDKAAQG